MLQLLGARVLRHEEFETGCEATCNGPYSGYWSKTMVGWLNEDTSFVFELTFNYGVTNYERGNDLHAIVLHQFNKDGEDMKAKLLESTEGKQATVSDEGVYSLINNDFQFKFEVTETTEPRTQLVKSVVLNCTNVQNTSSFYQRIGLSKVQDNDGVLKYEGFDYFNLELRQVATIERKEAYGRLAVACADQDVQNVFENSGAKV